MVSINFTHYVVHVQSKQQLVFNKYVIPFEQAPPSVRMLNN